MDSTTITLTGAHVRQACNTLRWTNAILSRKAHVPYKTVKLLRPRVNIDSDVAAKLLHAFEAAGVEFVEEDGGVVARLKTSGVE